ncbi:hypothetical protein RVX_R04030 [Nitratidesulfovibrio sp. HK-II]|jgi:hypothetical protein|uniref:hypothetical protein n=1 Tax=Nitratidesulfovibrio sp. HK-II TaxID=2009266 RepID=UPI000E2EFD19|nr:hypothetical protein [Nitratidesulfovibrio sp. HK-II]GBO96990.1 hypothetical protein RVX_2029 [Nitratidesulfovibrio sp. HK-II]
MDKIRKEALQVTKEIVVKFIETQRVSPASLGEVFPSIYRVVLESIATDGARDGQPPVAPAPSTGAERE